MSTNAWSTIYETLEKADPLSGLFFVMHLYYGRSIKELSSIFKLKMEYVSSCIRGLEESIRQTYTRDGGIIGTEGNMVDTSEPCYPC